MADTYHLSAPAFPDKEPRDFDELPNDDEMAPSNDDHRAMEIVNRTIKENCYSQPLHLRNAPSNN